MIIDEKEDSSKAPIPLKDKESTEEKKEEITTDLIYIPKYN